MQKRGFTLAEVLITLGIIGVVAAITIPTLVQKYQKFVWVNQLKAAVNIWEQGMQKMMADEEVFSLKDTRLCKVDSNPKIQNPILREYFKVIKSFNVEEADDCNNIGCHFGVDEEGNESIYKHLSGIGAESWGSGYTKVYLNNGILYGMLSFCDTQYNTILIDINSDNKGPNQWGRDVFAFFLQDNGHLVPVGANEDETYYWKGNKGLGCSSVNDSGLSCAARIMQNGWKMDY